MHLLYIRFQMLQTGDLPSFEDELKKEYIPRVLSILDSKAAEADQEVGPVLCLKNLMNAPSTNTASTCSPSYLVTINYLQLPKDLNPEELLPQAIKWREFIEMTVRIYDLLQVFEGVRGPMQGSPRAKCMVAAGNKPADGMELEMDRWYRDEHLAMLAAVPGHRRSTRWRTVSAQLKMPSAEGFVDATGTTPPHLALHEFDDEYFDREEIRRPAQTEWSKRIVGGYQVFERDNWNLLSDSE